MRTMIGAALAMASAIAGSPTALAMSGQGAAASECSAASLGDATLYLRGGMSGWAAVPENALRWTCDGYELVTELQGTQEFKIADADWSDRLSFAAPPGGALSETDTLPVARVSAGGGGNLRYRFDGWHRIRLSFSGDAPQLTIARAAPPPPATENPVALSLRHDSRALSDKAPFGAVPTGTRIAFAMDAASGVDRATLVIETRRLEGNQELIEYREQARVPMTRTRQGGRERWTAGQSFAAPGVYGYWFEVEIGGQIFAYGNNGAPIYWTRERGAGGVGSAVPMPADRGAIRRFRQTVYAPDFRVPGWAEQAIYYYIFPERFRNGDATNDAEVGFGRPDAERHAHWSDRPFRPESGDGSDRLYSNDFFGGDLDGITEKLDHIATLGANTIYMTPIFAAASNHKYDTGDYREVDAGFGGNAAFDRLTAEARRRGMRVIVDASFNHSGRDSVYFDRYARRPGIGALEGGAVRRDSPYASWYRLNPAIADPDDRYTGWTGAKDLPELNDASASFRAFAFGDRGSITRRWLDAGASGWRMDVAPWVPDGFWRDWRKALKAHDPEAVTIAETWFDSSKYFLGDTFDGTMNYIFRDTAINIAAGGNAAGNYRNIELTRELYPPQALRASMNLLSTHDTARTLWLLGARDDDAASIAAARRRYRLAALMQVAWPGAPTVYYGDEVGLSGGEDPDNRRTFPWADQGGRPDEAMLADMRHLLSLRRRYPVLATGSLSAPLFADAHVVAVQRGEGAHVALVAINNAEQVRTVDLRVPSLAGRTLYGTSDGQRVAVARDGRVRLTVPALFGTILTGGPVEPPTSRH